MKRYDFALAWNSGSREKFVRWVRKECSLKGLNFFLINEKNVIKIINDLEKGKLKKDNYKEY